MISLQLLQQRQRRLPQPAAGAAEGHGDARIEHVAQLGEYDALLVLAQLRKRHRGAAARGAAGRQRHRAVWGRGGRKMKASANSRPRLDGKDRGFGRHTASS
eukprot:scaffold106656_cov64-Phaeocystis_antarctica.AAC.2